MLNDPRLGRTPFQYILSIRIIEKRNVLVTWVSFIGSMYKKYGRKGFCEIFVCIFSLYYKNIVFSTFYFSCKIACGFLRRLICHLIRMHIQKWISFKKINKKINKNLVILDLQKVKIFNFNTECAFLLKNCLRNEIDWARFYPKRNKSSFGKGGCR